MRSAAAAAAALRGPLQRRWPALQRRCQHDAALGFQERVSYPLPSKGCALLAAVGAAGGLVATVYQHSSLSDARERGETFGRYLPEHGTAAARPQHLGPSIEWGRREDYEVLQLIGRGSSGEVFEGVHSGTGEKHAMKRLKAATPQRLQREVRVLEHVRGGPNIIRLRDVVHDSAPPRSPWLVFEHVRASDHRTLYPTLRDEEVRLYMYELLRALDHCHGQGVMHRDVKPRNVLIDADSEELRLIDFGLAEFYTQGREYSVRVSSLHYKPPELLVGIRRYGYSLDVWSSGCMLAGLLFKREPFFSGQDDQDQLLKIARVLGTADLHAYVAKYRPQLKAGFAPALPKCPRRPWSDFVTEENREMVSPEALDLLQRMLVYDHAQRISPREALEHPYFEPVRGGRRRSSSATDRGGGGWAGARHA